VGQLDRKGKQKNKRKVMGANYTAVATFKAMDKMSKPFKMMTKAGLNFAQKTDVALSRLERRGRRLTKSFNKLTGIVGRLGLGFGALLIAGQVIRANIDLDNSLQSLQAITGVTGTEFKSFANEIDNVSKRQLIFAGDTAKAFELVGSAKPELLKSADALGKVTEAAIILGKAGKLEIVDSVNALTTAMNQYGAGADKASEFVDILATAQQKGSGTIKYLNDAIIRSGSTLKTFNVSFADSVTLIEGYAKAGIEASVAGTALSSIMGKLAKSNKKEFNPTYTNAIDLLNNLKKANLTYLQVEKLVGAEQAKNLLALINQNDIVQQLAGNLNEVGNAQSQADIQMMSFGNILKQIQDAFKNVISSTDTQNENLLFLKRILKGVAVNMGTIIKIVSKVIGSFLLYKAAIILTKSALLGYNIVLGLSTALSSKSIFALRGNTVALAAYKVAMGIATAAQWLFNAAMNANPIGLIITGIAALIALVAIIIKKWETWGAALSLFLGPLGLVISLVQSFRKNWELVKASFSTGGLLKGLLTIGKVILDAILMPVQQLLELIGKIPGLNIANKGAAKIAGLRENLFAQERALIPKQELNTTKATQSSETKSTIEKVSRQSATLNINNNTDNPMSVEAPKGFPVKLSTTN
jgi:TP901 family phage tail tape measure protein